MKKTLIVLLIATVFALPIFAESATETASSAQQTQEAEPTEDFYRPFSIGATYGPSWGFMNADSDIDKDAANSVHYHQVQLSLDGTWYARSGLGVGFGVSLVIPIVYWEYGQDFAPMDTVFPEKVKPYASFRYKLPLSQTLSTEFGLGLYLKAGTKPYDGVTYKALEFGAEADAAITFTNPDEELLLKAGLKAAVPFYSRVTRQVIGGRISQYGVEIIPFIGIYTTLGNQNRQPNKTQEAK